MINDQFCTWIACSVPRILGSLTGTLSRQSRKAGIKSNVGYKKKKNFMKKEAWILHLLS